MLILCSGGGNNCSIGVWEDESYDCDNFEGCGMIMTGDSGNRQ